MLAGLQNVTFEFGARTIVEDATWHIHPSERIGLIGYNGTGKSTLLKVIVGEYLPSKGTVERSRGTSIGYLHQDLLSFDTNESILEVALHAFDRAKKVQKELDEITVKLETDSSEELLLEYSHKLHEFEEAGGYEIEHKTEEVLQGLGFANADLQRPYREFSGGWRMRVLLAKMILQAPDLLLLDEPTNHLDLPSIEWLEKYLQHYKGAVVIVSHDKYFLNRMVKKIVELYQRELHIYNGNYDYYEKEKAVRIEMQQKAYENQQDYIRQNERLIERFRAKASKAAMAQSVIKKLDKLDRIEDAALERPDIRINFNVDKTPGKVLVELKHVSKHFKNIDILENASAEIERGDKIALIGANGKGKSTLLRIIAGTEPFEGERKWGHNIDPAFYAQHQLESLHMDNTLLDEMREAGAKKTDLELRALLGGFLFGGDDVDKKIKVLSGGEKARVALAKTIISKANFLLLDEPTNHLDIHSTELLIEALNRYEGSIILVSHDRYFISKIANKIWEIKDKEIKEFKGGYEEWVEWNERMAAREISNRQSAIGNQKQEDRKKESSKKQETIEPKEPRQSAVNQSTVQAELKKQQKLFQKLEKDVAELTAKKDKLEAKLAHPDTYSNGEEFKKTEAAYKDVTTKLEAANKEYEIVFEKMISLDEDLLK
ncbi:ABC-F family ATP-binding cassette domain-containing protein [Flavisolibacter ginsenosidimutans]|uniref:Probable ATP-binding protein YbiT n=1 Tax=Flavisolibacter ginsenosidimutans TaxID=661481 RepID=A0A5B8UEA9_9BACT|nr:ABC-F family ATP-binding cassette domain-containing protein [Flavisolibacter ginsenosidimutans]QEC54762.1 ABC-F family ATP-binding cassette domain-containing protein [Flavisolibacter ginsenosidimutans]